MLNPLRSLLLQIAEPAGWVAVRDRGRIFVGSYRLGRNGIPLFSNTFEGSGADLANFASANHLDLRTIAVADSNLQCLILRELSFPPGVPEEEWTTESVPFGDNGLVCLCRSFHVQSRLDEILFASVHSISAIPSLVLASLDSTAMAPESVVISMSARHSDIFIFGGGEFAGYARIPLGEVDAVENIARYVGTLRGLVGHWWEESLPGTKPTKLYFHGAVPVEMQSEIGNALAVEVAPAPQHHWLSGLGSLHALATVLAKNEKRATIPESLGSRNLAAWFTKDQWRQRTLAAFRWLGGLSAVALAVCLVLTLGLGVYSAAHYSEISAYRSKEKDEEKLRNLRSQVNTARERLSHLVALRTHKADQVARITTVLPEDTWITHWAIHGQSHGIEGFGANDAAVPAFMTGIGAPQCGMKVKLRTTERSRIGTVPALRFEIEVAP